MPKLYGANKSDNIGSNDPTREKLIQIQFFVTEKQSINSQSDCITENTLDRAVPY